MGKHDGEVETLGQLVVNLTRELLETNRNRPRTGKKSFSTRETSLRTRSKS